MMSCCNTRRIQLIEISANLGRSLRHSSFTGGLRRGGRLRRLLTLVLLHHLLHHLHHQRLLLLLQRRRFGIHGRAHLLQHAYEGGDFGFTGDVVEDRLLGDRCRRKQQ